MSDKKNNAIPNKQEIAYAKKIGDLIHKSPCAFWCIENQKNILINEGYELLNEGVKWSLKAAGKYFTTRNNSCIMAWRMPKNNQAPGFMMVNSHSDFPSLKLKHNPETRVDGKYTILNVEVYGGPIMSTWVDTPLSIAGRIYIKTNSGIQSKLVNVQRDLALIPNMPIHQNRGVNDGYKYNPQIDLQPILGDANCPTVNEIIAKEADVQAEDIIDTELYLYRREEAKIWGADNQFMSSRSIDDQACAFSSLAGFLEADNSDSVPVHIVFDNEEIGSGTKQGAASSFYGEILRRIAFAMGKDEEEYFAMLANSINIAADNGHALHPNHMEKTDPTNKQYMGGGALLKYSAAFNYTTDSTSGAIIKTIAKKHNARLQDFFNRSDVPGGNALGKYLTVTGATIAADIGLPQLAMHSAYETCSVKDLTDLKNVMKGVFSSSIKTVADGQYELS